MPFKKIDTTSSVELVAAVSGARIRVTGLFLSMATASTIKLQSATTDLMGTMSLAAATPLVLPSSPPHEGSGERPGYCETATGEALNIVLGGAVQTSGVLEYEVRYV